MKDRIKPDQLDKEAQRDLSKAQAQYESGDRLRPPAGGRRGSLGSRLGSATQPALGENQMRKILDRLERLTGFVPPEQEEDK